MEDPALAHVETYRRRTVNHLWNLTNHFNVLNHDRWINEINVALHEHEQKLVSIIQEEGYDQMTVEERWTFPAALMFALRYVEARGCRFKPP